MLAVVKIATTLPYAGNVKQAMRQIRDLESAGLDLVWVAEAYGFDAVSLLGYLAAVTETVELGSGILPIYTRTPTLTAMTAAGLDELSDGRFVLGLGASGPQVVEGFHGVPYDRPVARTREIVEICRRVWAREAPLVHDGAAYHVPLPPEQGTGLGKPLKLINTPVRDRIPIFVAAMGAKNVELTAELAEGWAPFFMFPEAAKEIWGDALAAGFAKRDPALGALDTMVPVGLAVGDGVADRVDSLRGMVALYVGGMGARGANFYNDLAVRAGYADAAATIQDLYLSGNKAEAEAAVPADLLASISLVGEPGYVKDRVAAFAEAGATTLMAAPIGPTHEDRIASIRALAEIIA
jgi:F420-dependent oxidoreductase-like protein